MKVPVERARRVWAALWIGILVSVVASPSTLAQSTLTAEAKTALQEGIAAAKFQNWDAAQKHFDEALAAAPGAPEILFNQGLLYDRKGGAELVASAWYRAYLAAVPAAQNRAQIEARLIELHASAEARAAKFMATAKEAAKALVPTVSVNTALPGEDRDCRGGFRTLLRGEVKSGHFESVDEVVGWFQGNECQNDFLYYVVAAHFAQDPPQEASRYAERISGPWKVSALILFAAVKWTESDKAGAIQLVEEAETVATQLLKGLGESTFIDKYYKLRLRSELALAWCLVGSDLKARRSLERIDPNTLSESIMGASGLYYFPFESTFKTVAASLLSSGKEKEARAALRVIVSRTHNDWMRESIEQGFEKVIDAFKNKPHEELIALIETELRIYYDLPRQHYYGLPLPAPDWSEKSISVKSARENGKTEQDFWIEMATTYPALYGDVYRDSGKFLATASGSDAENTVVTLSKGSADLISASRMIRKIAVDWQKD